MPSLRKDLNGLRIKIPEDEKIYLIDEGKKRHIPNETVYDNLFQNWDGIKEDLNIDDITTGDDIPIKAFLFKCQNDDKVFLRDLQNGKIVKRHIFSPKVMVRYNFSWDRMHYEAVDLDLIGILDGSPIKNPP